MPTFNNGVFERNPLERIEFRVEPSRRLRTLSSALRWYWPYAPGDRISFRLQLRSLNGGEGYVEIYRYTRGEKYYKTWAAGYAPTWRTTDFGGITVPGEGAVDYRIGEESAENSKLLVSAVAVHNDRYIFAAAGFALALVAEALKDLLPGLLKQAFDLLP